MNEGSNDHQHPSIRRSISKQKGEYFTYEATENDMWQFFNPVRRNWEFLRILKKSTEPPSFIIILRNNWVIRKVLKGRPAFYYEVINNRIKNIRPEVASTLAYKYAVGIRELEVNVSRECIRIDLNSIHLPNVEYKKLIELGELIQMPENNYLLIPTSKVRNIYELLKPIGIIIKAKGTEPLPENSSKKILKSKLSDILILLYSKYLKKESEIESLLVALLNKDFSNIYYPKVKLMLEEIYSGTTQENNVLGKFLSEKVISFFDWKDLQDLGTNSTITGLILATSSKEYNSKWANNYYKIIIPELESVLHLQTTLSPSKSGIGEIHPLAVRLFKISLNHWRIYPYLGKLKNTGTSEEVRFEHSEKNFIDSCFSSILGIPSIEMVLRELCYLDSFKLDLEEWRGSYDLTRYFLAHVKVTEGIYIAARTPCLLVEDFFRNRFLISWDFDTYTHFKGDIHSIQAGGYISILLENKLSNIENSVDKIDFETVYDLSYRFVKKEDFISENVLAIIKYFGSIELVELENLCTALYNDISLNQVLKMVSSKNTIVIKDDVVYYRYRCLDTDHFEGLLDAAEGRKNYEQRKNLTKRWYILWSLVREIRSSVHPLIHSEGIYTADNNPKMKSETYPKLLEFCKEMKIFHQLTLANRSRQRQNYLHNFRRDEKVQFHDTFVGDKNPEIYVKDASFMLRTFGKTSIKARGRWISKAHEIAKFISRRHSYMEPYLKRFDRITESPGGRRVKETEFLIDMKVG